MSDTTITMRGLAGSVPELKISATNRTSWTSFRMATTPSRRTAQGEWADRETMWFTVKAFGKLAEHVVATVRKGMPLTVLGTLYQEEWVSPEGQQRKDLKIEARSVALDMQGAGRFAWTRGSTPVGSTTAIDRAAPDYGIDPGPIDGVDPQAPEAAEGELEEQEREDFYGNAGADEDPTPIDISDLIEAKQDAPF